ncbi:MAG: HAAAP family serine/threonine permease [Pantoea sp. Brub]|nr:HAAAP family serine/threonine permease [Pantoea sp. Brub]
MKINKTSKLNIAKLSIQKKWHKNDTIWVLSLYGTAIGAGALFLPINAGIGGLIPLIIITILAFPTIFFSHLALTRFVLSGKDPTGDITKVIEEHFGINIGNIIILFYFFGIYPTLLMYGVAMTNTVNSFIINQLQLTPPSRIILSLILISSMMIVIYFDEKIIIKATTILVYPFIIILMLITFYLIPHWQLATLKTLNIFLLNVNNLWMTLWLALPVLVFSFNHISIISYFALVKRKEYGDNAENKCYNILTYSHLLMIITVMFFVFSCVLSLSTTDLQVAKQQNITILSYLANHLHSPIIAWLSPLLAIIAIAKSFFGHYLGVRESFNRIVTKLFNDHINLTKLNNLSLLFVLLSSWLTATINPNILKMIDTLGGPVVSIILFLMPMYAIRKTAIMNKYRGKISNYFVVLIGLITISGMLYLIVN